MSDFSYTASGSISLGGCASYKMAIYLYFQYQIGSFVFSKEKALKGVYETIVIKKVEFPNYNILYTDTYNALWSENELVPYSQAKILVDNYFEWRDETLKQLALKCAL